MKVKNKQTSFSSNLKYIYSYCIDTSSVEDFMRSRPHTIDNRQIDPKRASKNIYIIQMKSIGMFFFSY